MPTSPEDLTVCGDCAAVVPTDRADHHAHWHTEMLKSVARAVKAELDRDAHRAARAS